MWTLVRIWPVLRLIWWWTPEIAFTVLTAWGWTTLATNTPAWLTLAVLAALAGLLGLLTTVRRWVIALFWCVAVRHRLRVCFSQFIIANRSGSLPLIFGAWPTPVGERVWVMLRPGLSLPYLAQQLDKIAVACHATTVSLDKAGRSDSAFVRFDIKRREVLTATVGSPLVEHIQPVPPMADKESATVTGLDLPDVPEQDLPASEKPKATASSNSKKPAASAATVADVGDDISDWI